MTHDPNGPSQLAKREGCPGSGRMEEATRAEEASAFGAKAASSLDVAADGGNKLHAALADCLSSDRRPVAADFPALDAEEIDALQLTYDFAQPVMADVGDNELILIEAKLDLLSLGMPQGGTLDFARVSPGAGFYMIDWKFGGLPVSQPRYNRQMQAYAYGLVEQYGCTHGTVAIVQPRAATPVKLATFAGTELTERAGEIRSIVTRARMPDAPLIPGEHCVLCRARPTCPARRALAEATIASKGASTLATFASMEPAKRLDAYERMKLAKSWVEGALHDIDAAILGGTLEIPGIGIGEGRKVREWLSDWHAIEAMKAAGIDPDVMFERELISPAKAEKVAGKARAATLRPAIISTPGKPRVVRTGTSGLIGDDE